jgi:hypothetical protein
MTIEAHLKVSEDDLARSGDDLDETQTHLGTAVDPPEPLEPLEPGVRLSGLTERLR